jgi:hypothetical protein
MRLLSLILIFIWRILSIGPISCAFNTILDLVRHSLSKQLELGLENCAHIITFVILLIITQFIFIICIIIIGK